MIFLKALAEYLDVAVTGITVGTNLYAGTRPATAPDVCTVILEQTGAPISNDGARIMQYPVQFLSRGTTYWQARSEAWQYYDALSLLNGFDLEGWRCVGIQGLTPQSIGQDAEGRFELSMNLTFNVKKDMT